MPELPPILSDKKMRKLLVIPSILVLFAVGLVGYYIFSAPYGDGLESTMEEAGVEEGEPVYTAPLDYGEAYGTSLVMGTAGFALAGGAAYLLGGGLKKEDASQNR